MKFYPTKIIKLISTTFVLFLFFSCETDTDLLTDMVLEGAIINETSIDVDSATITLDEDKAVSFNILNNTVGKGSRRRYKNSKQPKNGGLLIQKDSIAIYTPDFDFNGKDVIEITLEVTNEDNTTSDVTMTVDVTVNPTKDVVEDKVETIQGSTLLIEPLENDNFNENSHVKISKISNASKGSVVINDDNTLTYTPNSGTTGIDLFTYSTEITNLDESVTTETANITVTINNPGTPVINSSELKAFPTAYGAGAYATGGRGGKVIIVKNLNNNGPGSFREAMLSSGKRTIVFEVSGTILLSSSLSVNNGNFTIAGQTAPMGGITITGKEVYFNNIDNAIIRYIRFRPIFNGLGNVDAVNFSNCTNMVVDHLSVSWGGDEGISFIGNTKNISIQRLLIGESKTGTILGDSNNPSLSENLSLHNSMYYNISHRFPNPNSDGRVDVINNVVHNWNYRLKSIEGNIKLNDINNYYQNGCRSQNAFTAIEVNRVNFSSNTPSIYTSGNLLMNNDMTDANANNWPQWQWWKAPTGKKLGDIIDPSFQSNSMFNLLGSQLNIKTARDAFINVTGDVGADKVIDNSGNVKSSIDPIDLLYRNNVINNVCASYKYYGTGYGTPPNYSTFSHYINFFNSVSNTPLNKHNSNYDSDGDGMPNAWEVSMGLNPNDSSDGNEDLNSDGYTNLEDFLNRVDF